MVLHLRTSSPPGPWKGAKCLNTQVSREYDPWFGLELEADEDGLPSFRDEDVVMDEARDMCNGTDDGVICPIRHECLIFALTNNLREGVFGGSTPLDRKAIRKQWPLKSGKVPRPEWKWFENGEPVSWFGADNIRAELDAEYDIGDDDD
jgi:Transcription factor WhiB